MYDIKVSIIIPIYNAAKYLHRCLECILQQSYKNIEILLVNDGSTDESNTICLEYANKDPRIRYFKRTNHGVSATREFAVQKATGKYLIHFDSDDWASTNMIEDMLVIAEKTQSDIVIADFYVNLNDQEIYRSQRPSSLKPKQIMKEILQGSLHGSTWNKLIKTSLLERYNIHFPVGINHSEDVVLWIQLLQHPLKIIHLPKAYYHYDNIVSEHSITRHYTHKTLEERKTYVQLISSILNKKEYHKIITQIKLSIKFEVFESNILSASEFHQLFPEATSAIWKRNTSIINRSLLWIASLGYLKLAHNIYVLKNKI